MTAWYLILLVGVFMVGFGLGQFWEFCQHRRRVGE